MTSKKAADGSAGKKTGKTKKTSSAKPKPAEPKTSKTSRTKRSEDEETNNDKPTNDKPATRLPSKQLDEFKTMLLAKRKLLQGDVDAMEVAALKGSSSGDSGELSHMPLHLADLGTDNYEQDFTLGLIESEEEEMREIDEALERIAEGTFGICENCDTAIPVERIKALPHSRFCVKCQTQYEEEQQIGGESGPSAEMGTDYEY